ncbi:peptide-methionine (S)-S-oxide reductase MsrA [Candidatus Albibeggiatoa sp. nov. NOAA]|uniref:peptide-methionine (S)-S-oxide reductase MsrA n=1 Tax=Candidatus Albibeggiatoa sp. nov. NOAA TaxID=3162724 RepID=UPI0032FCAFC3|nr:peptide-methionine (S)-S-oxide reductase MsrA [Thiotrichaceae bacterium]
MEIATFAAGCFWGVEATFQNVKGVQQTRVGYTGGTAPNPSYEMVCTGRTGHAEAIEVTYDENVVGYETLLNIFWQNHNPTTLNRQGPDRGTQYRSAIFYHTEAQKQIASLSKQQLGQSGAWPNPIVTEITPASEFYAAEDYHQRYLEKRGMVSCHV